MHNYAIPEQTFLDCLPFGIHFPAASRPSDEAVAFFGYLV